jgi:hypothetical protein
MSPTGSTNSLSPVSLLQQNRPSAVTPLASRPASPRQEDQPNPLETHELHCHQARGGLYAAQLKRARSQTPSTRSNSRLDCAYLPRLHCSSADIPVPPLSRQVSPSAPSPVASSSSGARYLNRDPATGRTPSRAMRQRHRSPYIGYRRLAWTHEAKVRVAGTFIPHFTMI